MEFVGVGFGSETEAAVDAIVDLNIVVSIDAENLFDHIAFASYINFAGGYEQ